MHSKSFSRFDFHWFYFWKTAILWRCLFRCTSVIRFVFSCQFVFGYLIRLFKFFVQMLQFGFFELFEFLSNWVLSQVGLWIFQTQILSLAPSRQHHFELQTKKIHSWKSSGLDSSDSDLFLSASSISSANVFSSSSFPAVFIAFANLCWKWIIYSHQKWYRIYQIDGFVFRKF